MKTCIDCIPCLGSACCPADIAPDSPGDCVVNVSDLLELLGQWGGPGTGDIAGGTPADGVVNVQDLLALLASWGPCE